MPGAAIVFDGNGVRCISANLSKSRPLFTPHQSMAFAFFSSTRLITNSLVSAMMS